MFSEFDDRQTEKQRNMGTDKVTENIWKCQLLMSTNC